MAEKKLEHGRCPFCDEEISEASYPYCDACGLAVQNCPTCGISVAKDAKECPNCHAKLTKAGSKGG